MSAGDTDHDYSVFARDLGGITQEEVMGRGRIQVALPDVDVQRFEARVRKTGVLERLQDWRAEDSLGEGFGGRPALINDRAILTGMLLANRGEPIFITRLARLFQHELSDASRALLGLEPSFVSFVEHVAEQNRWYSNTHRAFHRMNDLMDPFPQERWRAKTHTEIQQILNAHDSALELTRKARLDEFTKLFLLMTFNEQPRDVRRASRKIDLSFDQTYVGTPTTKGYSKKGLSRKVTEEAATADLRTLPPGPVDAYAGWHVRTGERTDNRRGELDTASPQTKGTTSTNYAWGWEANIAVRVDSEKPGSRRFPALAVAATLSLPNVNVAEEAVSLMRAAKATGLQPGIGDADKRYWANSLVERLHEPAFAEGFTPSTDYRVDRLGVQGGANGALFIEGGAYCPGTPTALQNASIAKSQGTIDSETYRARIGARKAFKLHVKEKADGKGRTMLRCPALGPSPTVTCPLRELLQTRKIADKERPAVDAADLPDFPDKICRQHSASFDEAEMRRTQQAFDYGTQEWDTFHTHARNSIESLNAQIKAGGTEDIQSANRRRVRGMGAAQIIVTILLTNFNLRKIAAFLSDKFKADMRAAGGRPAKPNLIRRRDREFRNPYTDTYPAGVERPDKARPAPSDETGGPPLRT
ncbi:hypothetical protein [Microterricola pindariensis]|uniref:Transposase DDE domain-containing protein n=1 Tax=Microterricola pindariensis TaxID=478010 RepID=A0ABX5AW77_9MICO|nr:hypothetical protein [Microterricola pindariensis]PPL18634.1 hypothetical protein GY24_10170 [Microterricola pindariensis]